MPNADHFGFSDELVNSPRALGKMGKMVFFPPVNCVVLHERKRASGIRNNPARYPGISQVRFVVWLI